MTCPHHQYPTRGCEACRRVALPCIDDVRRIMRELDSAGDKAQDHAAANAYWDASARLREVLMPKDVDEK